MIRQILKIISVALLAVVLFNSCQGSKMKALVVTGQNTNNWEISSDILSNILENSDLFKVDVTISPASGEDMSGFIPAFDKYDLVVLDYNGDEWSDEVKSDFEKYLNNGGGVVVCNASINSFPGWEAFGEITGSGEFSMKEDEFAVFHSEPDHPILKGIPESWMHSRDKKFSEIQAPAENRTVLATSVVRPNERDGNPTMEPVISIIKKGEGLVFITSLGYVGEDAPFSLQCAGFILTLQRGAEWAATGTVTQELPPDLPNIATPLLLPSYKPYSLDELFQRAKSYEFGKSEKYLYLISNRIRLAKADPVLLMDYENRIINLLESDATAESKNYLCNELSWMGSDAVIPVLEKLLEDDATKDAASFALQRIQE